MNQRNISYLEKIRLSGEIPHALLFAGPVNSPKEEAAIAFSKKLVESEHSLYHFHPEGGLGMHTIDSLRSFIQEAFLPPYEGSRKALLIFEAEKMLQTGSNALLKTLEEPLKTSTILLISSFPEKLLPTIRSRCQTLYFAGESALPKNQLHKVTEILASLDSLTVIELLALLEKLATDMNKTLEIPENSLSDVEKDFTALQKHALEKEAEGKSAVALSYQLELIWEAILGWFRDLHLLLLQGNPAYLCHPAYKETLQQWVEKGIAPPIETIQRSIEHAREAMKRSGNLKNTLESLFLGLKRSLLF